MIFVVSNNLQSKITFSKNLQLQILFKDLVSTNSLKEHWGHVSNEIFSIIISFIDFLPNIRSLIALSYTLMYKS